MTAQLPDLLLHVAVVRPVFIWGQPGIGKSSLVEEFAAQVEAVLPFPAPGPVFRFS